MALAFTIGRTCRFTVSNSTGTAGLTKTGVLHFGVVWINPTLTTARPLSPQAPFSNQRRLGVAHGQLPGACRRRVRVGYSSGSAVSFTRNLSVPGSRSLQIGGRRLFMRWNKQRRINERQYRQQRPNCSLGIPLATATCMPSRERSKFCSPTAYIRDDLPKPRSQMYSRRHDRCDTERLGRSRYYVPVGSPTVAGQTAGLIKTGFGLNWCSRGL